MNYGAIFWIVVYLISTVLFFVVAGIITFVGLMDLKFLTRGRRMRCDKSDN
jgi:hypothetical protein